MLTPEMIKELKDIEAQNDGDLPVDAIVAVARNPRSALHTFPAFKWDLQQAAMEHWKDAARSVMQVYITVWDRGDGIKVPGRAYVTTVNEEGSHVYRPTVKVLREDRTRLIESILDRLSSQLANYPLPEFEPIIEAIDDVRASLKPKPKPRPPGRRTGRGGSAERRV